MMTIEQLKERITLEYQINKRKLVRVEEMHRLTPTSDKQREIYALEGEVAAYLKCLGYVDAYQNSLELPLVKP